MSQPRFTKECIDAYNEMNTQESPNDFMVCDFGENLELTLVEKGKGGMERVKEILREQYTAKTAIALFRVTAVDDRENTVSYRTKIVHTIYTGPKTPVVKRAKVGTFNAAFKQPFSVNLSIQTDDVDGDLAQAPIERSLLASGGAHPPKYFDFKNESAPGERSGKKSAPSSPAAAEAPKPSPVAKAAAAAPKPVAPKPQKVVYAGALEIHDELAEAVKAQDPAAVVQFFAEDGELVHTDATERATRSYKGLEDIKSFYTWWFERLGGQPSNVISVDASDSVVRKTFDCEAAGLAYGSYTFYSSKGKIVLLTLVTADVTVTEEAPPAVEEAPAEEAPAEEAPAEEAPAEEAPAQEEAPAEEAPAEEAPAEEAPAEETPAQEEAPAEEQQ